MSSGKRSSSSTRRKSSSGPGGKKPPPTVPIPPTGATNTPTESIPDPSSKPSRASFERDVITKAQLAGLRPDTIAILREDFDRTVQDEGKIQEARRPSPPIHNAASRALSEEMGNPKRLRIHDDPAAERRAVHAALIFTYSIPKAPSTSFSSPSLGILTTAPVETFACVSRLMKRAYVTMGGWTYFLGILPDSDDVEVAIVKSDQSTRGSQGSQQAVAAMVSSFPSVRAIAAVGICWGVGDAGLQVGDIVIASSVQDVAHKRVRDGKVQLAQPLSPLDETLSRWVSPKAVDWSLQPDEPAYRPSKAFQGLVMTVDTLFDDPLATSRTIRMVRSQRPGETVLGGEMEGAGLVAVLPELLVPFTIIKAVVDFGGLGESKAKGHQPFAAYAAMDYLIKAVAVKDARGRSLVEKLPKAVATSLPTMDFDGFLYARVAGFVGREKLFEKIDAWRTGGGASSMLLLAGDAGAGKSAFFSAMVSLTPYLKWVAGYHVCQVADASTLDAENWLCNMSRRLLVWMSANRVPLPTGSQLDVLLDPALPVPKRWANFVKALPRTRSTSGPSMLLAIDSIDEALSANSAIIRSIAASQPFMPDWLRFICTTRSDDAVIKAIEKLVPYVTLMTSDTQEARRDLALVVGARMKDHTAEEIAKVTEAADGNFLYTILLLGSPHKNEILASPTLPKGLNGMYSEVAGRLFADKANWTKVAPIFGLVAAAQDSLPRLLFDKAVEAAGIPAHKIKDLLKGVPHMFSVTPYLVRFYHQSVEAWLMSDAPGPVNLTQSHAILANVCAEMWDSPGPSSHAQYARQYLVAHAVASGDAEALTKASAHFKGGLAHPDFLLSAARVGSVASVKHILWRDFWGLSAKLLDASDAEGHNVLSIAAGAGHVDLVQFLTSKLSKAAVNTPSAYGATPLHQAAHKGNLAIVNMLIDKGATDSVLAMDKGFHYPIYRSVQAGHLEVTKRLIELDPERKTIDAPCKHRKTPLQEASRRGHMGLIQALTENGAKLSEVILAEAVLTQRSDIVKYLKDHGARLPAPKPCHGVVHAPGLSVSRLDSSGAYKISVEGAPPYPLGLKGLEPSDGRSFTLKIVACDPGTIVAGIGLVSDLYEMPIVTAMPGFGKGSYGMDGERGETFSGSREAPDEYDRSWTVGEVFGCHWDREKRTLSFSRNGEDLGVAFFDVPSDRKMFPFVGLRSKGLVAELQLN